jgi:hypothetical protein
LISTISIFQVEKEKDCLTWNGFCLQSILSSMRFPDNKHERIQIRWAGKELAMDQKLSDYVGVNDKTKVTFASTVQE